MSSSYDKNTICWSSKICLLPPLPHRQSIISCICRCTSQLLFRASGWAKWLAASLMCQPDGFEICSPKAGGKQRCYTAARSACQLSGHPAHSRQASKTPCFSRLPLLSPPPLNARSCPSSGIFIPACVPCITHVSGPAPQWEHRDSELSFLYPFLVTKQ